MLPANDKEYLQTKSPNHSITAEAGMICVVLPGFALGNGFDRAASDLLVRLPAGYPDAAPDMWWFSPPVRRKDGAEIAATQSIERHVGKEWQRWSRHLQPGQWRSGIDSLESYVALVEKELRKASPAAAA